MSYCVECGVELAGGLESCPLCHTEVINPNQPVREETENPYPEQIEDVISRMDRGYARQLSILAALIPILVVLLLDIIDGGGAWSPYVMGAIVMGWCFLAVPLLFSFKRPYITISIDILALCAYLALVAAMNDGFSWYFTLVLPLLVLAGLFTLGMLLAYRRLQMRRLHRASWMTALVAVFLASVEIIIDLSTRGRIKLGWSLYAGIPFLVTALLLAGIERSRPLKEEIRKRLFL